MTSFKVLAAAVIVTCGLGLGVSTRWLATADAQTPGRSAPPQTDPTAEVKRLQAELDKVRQAAEAAAQQQRAADELLRRARLVQALDELRLVTEAEQKGNAEPATAKTTKWEYDFVVVSDITQAKFVEFLRDRENRGWEFNGTTTLRHEGKPTAVWVFRRPAKGAAQSYQDALRYSQQRVAPTGPSAHDLLRYYQVPMVAPATGSTARPDDVKAIEAEIARLQEKLAKMKARPAPARVVIPRKDLPLEAAELTEILLKLAGKRFKDGHYTITPTDTGLIVEGDKEVVEWVTGLVKELGKK